MMTQHSIKRVPMPKTSELSDIPSEARFILSQFKDNIPLKDYKNLARVVVDTANGKIPTLRNAKLYHDNPNLVNIYRSIYEAAGEYNPDKIPIATYEKMKLHPQIAIADAVTDLPIIAQNYRIDCTSKEIMALVNEALVPIYRNTVKELLKAKRYGFVAGQKIYDVKKFNISETDEEGKEKTVYNDWAMYIRKIKFAHPSSITVYRDELEDIKSVQQKPTTTNPKPAKIAIVRMVWFAPDEEYGNVFGDSRYKAAYQPWYWSQVLIQFMLRYMERRGSPSVICEAPPGQSVTADGTIVDNLELALKIAESVNSNSVAALPRRFDKGNNKEWDIYYLKDDARNDMFIDALKFLNSMITRAMLVPDRVAVSDSTNTNATAESHTDVHLLNEEAYTQYIEAAFNEQIIPDLVEWNFKEGERKPCTLKIERLNHSRKTLVKDILTRMIILAGGAMKDGYMPKYMPSLKKMLDFLEVPGEVFDSTFLLPEPDSGNPNDITPDPKDAKTDSTPLEKDQKVQDKNKVAPPRSERSRRDRKSRERL